MNQPIGIIIRGFYIHRTKRSRTSYCARNSSLYKENVDVSTSKFAPDLTYTNRPQRRYFIL